MNSRPYKQAYQTYEHDAYQGVLEWLGDLFKPQQAEAVGTVGPGGIGLLGKQALTDVLGKGVGEAVRQGQTEGGATSLADPEDPVGKIIFAALDWVNKDKTAPWVEGVKKFFRSPVTVYPQSAYAQPGTNKNTPCKPCIKGFVSRRTVSGGCYCVQVSTTSGAGVTPVKAGSSGNCNWDTKGGYCWTSSACGGRCRGCTSVKTNNINTGCSKARDYFIKNSSRCPGCGLKAGSSGNCNWDSKGGWCWTSTACGGRCRGCTNFKTTNINTGCNKARSYFLANSKRCPGCGLKAGSSGNCNWDSKGGWCWTSIACGKKCRGCTNVKTTNIKDGCNRARSYFLKYSSRCPGCGLKAGSSGNCSWDTKGGWCWTSSACGKRCRGCTTVKTTNKNTGCNKARSYFLNNSKRCPGCQSSGSGGGGSSGGGFKCPYSGCGGTGSKSQCYQCRCRGICNNARCGGVRTVSSTGGCWCKKAC